MKANIADSTCLNILGNGRSTPTKEIGATMLKLWRRHMGYFSLFAGAASLLAAEPREVLARGVDVADVRSRISKRAKVVADLNKCSKPELLKRQSEYRLPHQKGSFDMVSVLTGTDTCPGRAIPAGTYTTDAPYTDSGDTTGANNTVANQSCFGSFYYYYYYDNAPGPDHVYSFTLTGRRLNPQIQVSTSSGMYNPQIYIINGLTNERCPVGTNNYVNNCIVASDGSAPGGTEVITAQAIINLPLNVPLHLVVDSGSFDTQSNAGPYAIRMQDVIIADSVFPPANDAPLDMNGDGKSDFVVGRNTGGGASGQMTWHTRTSSDAFLTPVEWGIASDKFVPADYDGDGKDDFAVWRPGPQGRFYIFLSLTQRIQILDLGQTGDDPTVVADYTGDGIDDVAVYRDGATPGAQSFWFYRLPGTATGYVTVAWGQHGDKPAPGTYDGAYADFVVRRDEGANGRFYVRLSHNVFSSVVFGLANDMVVPGDYDGDGNVDISVVRPGADGIFVWDFEPSSVPGVTVVRNFWGEAATDTITQGDYDGDGACDLSVWRPGSPGTFYQKSLYTQLMDAKSWGQAGDIPVAKYNTR